jgi:protease-4
VMFYAGALQKLDVKPEIEKIGKYKDAPNVYTDSTLTPEHREALGSLLDDIYDEVTARIAESREMSVSTLRDIIDKGPFTSVQAESLGLIDGRLYPGEISNRVPAMFGQGLTLFPSAKYVTGPKFNERFYTPPEIAIVTVEGSIVGGTSGSSLVLGKTAGSATLSAAIRGCANDSRIKAIVVRLDTPGGNAAASDLIWGELTRARQRKPVVVSMSDLCTSGGYYIASASDQILVEPTTLTGSIGVYGGKADISGFYHKLGLTTATIKRGRNADFFSLTSPYSEEERAILRRQISDLYRNFVSLVAASRHLSIDSVDAIGQGRVWSGSSALRLGLADREGSLLDAVNCAAELAGLHDDYRVVEIPMRKSWPGVPNLMVMGLADLIGVASPGGLEHGIMPLAAGDDGAPQYRLPYDISIE